jgi:hypothetical protein
MNVFAKIRKPGTPVFCELQCIKGVRMMTVDSFDRPIACGGVLSKKVALQVIDQCNAAVKAMVRLTPQQRINLGCAYAWHGNCGKAREAFETAAEEATDDNVRLMAEHNLETLRKTSPCPEPAFPSDSIELVTLPLTPGATFRKYVPLTPGTTFRAYLLRGKYRL